MDGPDHKLRQALAKRARAGSLRQLSASGAGIDFCSNDYLGLARSSPLRTLIDRIRAKHPRAPLGSTGSRLISGNSAAAEHLEARLAVYHRAEAGLLFGSGYAANSGLFACIAGPGDTLIMDELIHASSVDGARLSKARKLVFRHNDLDDLAARLDGASGATFIGVESLYSMGGDTAPLPEMAALAVEYGAGLVVDEAHSNGITGPGGAGSVVENGLEDCVFARVHTFGKGLGLHGAVVLGSKTLRDYLVNFCRPFVYSTAPPRESLDKIEDWDVWNEDAGPVRVHKWVYLYLLSYTKGQTSDHDDEVDDAVWFPIEEAQSLLSFDSEQKVLRQAGDVLAAER